jgi:hypothetical protein
MRNCILRRFIALLAKGAGTDFVGLEAYIIMGTFFKKRNTKLGMKVNVYLE